MRRQPTLLALAILGVLLWTCVLAQAQSTPGLINGQVPTAAQWNSFFAAKQDTLGYTPLRKSGDVMTGVLRITGAAPVLSACGGGSPAVSGNNNAGIVTLGTSATGCVITFAAAWPVTPACAVTWQTNIATMQYVVSTTSITITQSSTSSNKINYVCIGLQ